MVSHGAVGDQGQTWSPTVVGPAAFPLIVKQSALCSPTRNIRLIQCLDCIVLPNSAVLLVKPILFFDPLLVSFPRFLIAWNWKVLIGWVSDFHSAPRFQQKPRAAKGDWECELGMRDYFWGRRVSMDVCEEKGTFHFLPALNTLQCPNLKTRKPHSEMVPGMIMMLAQWEPCNQ